MVNTLHGALNNSGYPDRSGDTARAAMLSPPVQPPVSASGPLPLPVHPLSGVCVVCSRKVSPAAPSGVGKKRSTPLPPLATSAIERLVLCHMLTRREAQVLTLVYAGLKNSVIARILGVSLPTVRLHMRNLHRKTSTADKVELILSLWHCCLTLQHPNPSPAGRPRGDR